MFHPYAAWSMPASSKIQGPRQMPRILVNDIKKEDVPILSQRPSYGEIQAFQKWITKIGRQVGINWHDMTATDCDIADAFWDDVKQAFYPDIIVPELCEVFTAWPAEYHEISLPEPTLRKKRRLA